MSDSNDAMSPKELHQTLRSLSRFLRSLDGAERAAGALAALAEQERDLASRVSALTAAAGDAQKALDTVNEALARAKSEARDVLASAKAEADALKASARAARENAERVAKLAVETASKEAAALRSDAETLLAQAKASGAELLAQQQAELGQLEDKLKQARDSLKNLLRI
ncbi:MAG: hypothetical protein RLZZ524_454 [Pseudomonadota bacterium]|jgi:cell division septum initiation protein DivIVA